MIGPARNAGYRRISFHYPPPTTRELLLAAQQIRPGETFTTADQTLVRSVPPNAHGDKTGRMTPPRADVKT